MIVFSCGSLYTSIIPNLLVDGIVEAVRRSDAVKVYACNVMTQNGETEGYTVSDHIRALFDHSCPDLFRYCLVNSAPIPENVAWLYAHEDAAPIVYDAEACAALGVEVICREVSTVTGEHRVRHDPDRLARALLTLYDEKTTEGV